MQVTTAGGVSANTGADDFTYMPPVTYDSYRGTDRYDTAIKLSKALFPAALPADSGLVLAPGETFPEALCGAPLAAAYGGPVLLTYKTALANNVKAEMLRLAPKYVVCIGLSTTTVNSVISAMGPTVTVIPINGAGAPADVVYDMSRKVANALKNKVGDMSGATAIVTRGDLFPDAIGVSPLACSELWPIILTNSGGTVTHASATATFADLGITQAIKVGTYATLPAGVTGRANLSGIDRYFTNANVANWAQTNAGLTFTHTGLATGDKFPDALASGPFLAKDGGILLLSPLLGPVPVPIATVLTTNRAGSAEVHLHRLHRAGDRAGEGAAAVAATVRASAAPDVVGWPRYMRLGGGWAAGEQPEQSGVTKRRIRHSATALSSSNGMGVPRAASTGSMVCGTTNPCCSSSMRRVSSPNPA